MKNITTDPVCGMEVESDSPWKFAFGEHLYHFCSEGCRARFVRQPEEFVEMREEQIAPTAGEGTSRAKIRPGRGARWGDYLPLVVLVTLTMLAAAARQAASAGGWDTMSWMRDFMGFLLVVFSMFKFFNLPGFADGFQMYDLLAKRYRPYAWLYPFLELGLGLGFLANWQPVAVSTATILLLLFGSLGVFRAIWKGLDLDCACMGTVLKVPLSTVALVEDLGMAAMAVAMLCFGG